MLANTPSEIQLASWSSSSVAGRGPSKMISTGRSKHPPMKLGRWRANSGNHGTLVSLMKVEFGGFVGFVWWRLEGWCPNPIPGIERNPLYNSPLIDRCESGIWVWIIKPWRTSGIPNSLPSHPKSCNPWVSLALLIINSIQRRFRQFSFENSKQYHSEYGSLTRWPEKRTSHKFLGIPTMINHPVKVR